jgi:hypothetical protein
VRSSDSPNGQIGRFHSGEYLRFFAVVDRQASRSQNRIAGVRHSPRCRRFKAPVLQGHRRMLPARRCARLVYTVFGVAIWLGGMVNGVFIRKTPRRRADRADHLATPRSPSSASAVVGQSVTGMPLCASVRSPRRLPPYRIPVLAGIRSACPSDSLACQPSGGSW